MSAHNTRNNRAPTSVYLATAIVIFFLALSAADSVGWVPCQIDGTCTAVVGAAPTDTNIATQSGVTAVQSTVIAPAGAILPTHIKITAVGIDLPVQDPTTTDLGALDTILQKGPARYADSATLGAGGNMIIFAHSSHLPIVHNQMYKAFNNIPDLKAGDTITLTGDDNKQYLYVVSGVRSALATEDEKIYLKSATPELTLVTCDTLTGKSARFIAEADFVGAIGG